VYKPALLDHQVAGLQSLLLYYNYPFVDGNKRTAITSAALFLRMNGYRLMVENEEMVRFTLACAQSQLPFEEIVDWFKQCSIKER
jgi:death on curing protein